MSKTQPSDMNQALLINQQPIRKMELENAPNVGGFFKLKRYVEFFTYTSTPQYLDQELMMQIFNE